jgi:AraC family transcriptional regulator
MHTGPYDTIGESYDALMGFVRENELEMDSFSYEFYLDDPRSTPPEELKTEIFFPVKE